MTHQPDAAHDPTVSPHGQRVAPTLDRPDALTTRRASWLLPVHDARVLVSGFQSWSPAELRDLRDPQGCPADPVMLVMGHDPRFPPSGRAGAWRSHTVIAVVNADGSGWAGAAERAEHGHVVWDAEQHPDGTRLTVTVEGEPHAVRLVWSENAARALEQLCDELGQRMHARTARAGNIWCSWYHYFTNVTWDVMVENTRAARARNLPFDVIQLDDGFQAAVGDWFEPNPHFGGHARDLPSVIHAHGFQSGVWLAPFIAGEHSRLFREQPAWFLRDASGTLVSAGHNWGGTLYALDLTRNDVQAWLEDLARTVTAWGYSYLKLDFLYAGTLSGAHHGGGNRIQAYRAGLEALRRGAGNAFLVGCGAPLAASVGLVDAMRVGPDVTTYWDDAARREQAGDAAAPSTRNAILTSVTRYFLRSWFTLDPDVVLLRDHDLTLTRDEQRTLVALTEALGGLRSISDPVSRLPEATVQLLRHTWRGRPPAHVPTTLLTLTPPVLTLGPLTLNLADDDRAGVPAHGAQLDLTSATP